ADGGAAGAAPGRAPRAGASALERDLEGAREPRDGHRGRPGAGGGGARRLLAARHRRGHPVRVPPRRRMPARGGGRAAGAPRGDQTRGRNMTPAIGSYLGSSASGGRRTEVDVGARPPQAAAWRPPAASGEAGWGIGQLVEHIGGSRLYFASAYRGEGWLFSPA